MPQQHDGLAAGFARKIHLQVIPEILRVVKLRVSAEPLESAGQERPEAVHCLLVVAGRLDFDQLPYGLDDLLSPAFEILQPRAQFCGGKPGVLLRFFHVRVLSLLHSRYSIIFALAPNEMTDLAQSVTETPAEKTTLDINEIMRILPHRYPLLLIDRVLELKRRERIVAIKNVTINEPFFVGHFPGAPVMPGVLIVEAIAQAGGALLLTEVEDRDSKLMFFTGIERAKFRRPVVPGDQLRIEIEVKAWRGNAVRMEGRAFVGDKRAAEAIVTCRLVDRSRAGNVETNAESE